MKSLSTNLGSYFILLLKWDKKNNGDSVNQLKFQKNAKLPGVFVICNGGFRANMTNCVFP